MEPVTDPTGAAIQGVTVTAINDGTNQTRTFKTDQEGSYRFSAPVIGTDTIMAEDGQRRCRMNMYNRRPEREPAPNNVPNNFIASYVWQLPVGKGKHFNIENPILNGAIGGWEVSGITRFISGMSFTLNVANDPANVLAGLERASATGVPPQRLDPRTNGLYGFNTAAYTTPAKGTFGNLGNNTQYGFGVNNWDLSVSKSFAIPKMGEASRLHIRAEYFNFANHAQFNNPGATVNVASTFGLVNSARDPRILQLGGKLYW